MNPERFSPEKRYEVDLKSRTDALVIKMRARPPIENSDLEALEKRRARVEVLLVQLGENAPQLLNKFDEIARKHVGQNFTFKEIALYVVGGNAHGGPFKETSDVDIVLAADPPLNPLAKDAHIDYAKRHAVAKELYAALQTIIPHEQGDFEIKGFGEKTPAELAERESSEKDVVRLFSKIG